MRIGIDILGGDFAPEANLDGVFMALSELPEDVVIVLIGDESVIKSKLSEVQVDHSRVEIIHADENITMHDHPTTRERRHNQLRAYQVNAELMAHANEDALFMHCLPAHRNEEATSEVMDGSNSVIFDEAENRLHAQKAVMRWCLGK